MTARVLLFRLEFGGAATAFGNVEQRVVAEATTAAPLAQDLAAPLARRNQRLLARRDIGGDAVESGAAILAVGQCRQQFVVIGLVTAVARVTGRVHAWRAAKRIDGKTGVVGDGRQPGRIGRVLRLDQGVLGECRAGFIGVADTVFRLGSDLDVEDKGKLRYSVENMPPGAEFDSLSLTFTWTPTYEQSGTYVLDFLVKDPPGALDRDASTITVVHIDRKPE